MRPKVSVVTAVYNGEKYIAETVQSILNQSMGDFEYILVDDASTDRSVEIISAFNDPRIKVIRNEKNSRLVITRNRGLEAATGEYVALIDHDDVALPNRLSRQLSVLEENRDLSLVGSLAKNIDANGVLLKARPKYHVPTPEHSRVQLIFRNHFVNSTIFYRRPKDGHYYSPEFQLAEDYDFIERISVNGGIHVIDEILVHYRVHNNNYSLKTQDVTRAGCRKIKSRQLERLGIVQDDRDQLIFENFEYPPNEFTPGVLAEMARMVEEIRSANNAKNIYDSKVLEDVAKFELYLIAQAASGSRGIGAGEIFSSPYLDAMKSKKFGVLKACIRHIAKIIQ